MIDVYKLLKKLVKVDIIYTSESGQQVSFRSEIIETFDDRILLACPVNNIAEFDIFGNHTKFTAIFYTEDGVLSGNITLMQNSVDDEKNIYVSFPYNNQFCQRRENTRIPMHVDFDLTLNGQQLALKTKNISGRGIACMTKEPLPDFKNAQIILHMPSSSIKIICRKVYSKNINLDVEEPILNGIEFTEISDNDVNTIVKDCLKFQLDSKHNERLFETL